MAASTVVPPRTAPTRRALVSGAAARSAPRGPGLATVVALPVRDRGTASAAAGMLAPALTDATTMALVATGVGLAASALAAPTDPAVGGHVVLQPGETLWDIAVRSAPAGTDPRTQLDTLRRLNGLGAGALDAWTVVLLPAV